MKSRLALVVSVLGSSWACCACGATHGGGVAPGPDRPVPSSEPRAELHLTLDLARSADCEEEFDLALYEERGVDLVIWDDARDPCVGRQVSIRYLSQQLSREALLVRVRELAATVRERSGSSARDGQPVPAQAAPADAANAAEE